MNLLHEYCGGYVETLDPENFGRCERCGEEGLFRIIRELGDNAYVIFYETQRLKKPLPICAARFCFEH